MPDAGTDANLTRVSRKSMLRSNISMLIHSLRNIHGLLFSPNFSGKGSNDNGPIKILDAPIHLGALVENMHKSEDEHNIWMAKRIDDSSVGINYTRVIP